MATDHFIFEPNKDGHKRGLKKTEGGACLTGHDGGNYSKFGRKQTCNYRYQAVEQAKNNSDIKKYLHSYNDVLDQIADKYSGGIPTSAYKAKSGNMSPARYCLKIDKPKEGDWDVGGPEKSIQRKNFKGKGGTIKKKHNFTQDTWPYWNNAHHLIPKGTLKALIVNEGSEVGGLIEMGLLKAKYNINHKRNMLLMPQDKEVGAILDMPRHIQLKECDANVKASCTNHPVYNEMVATMEDGLDDIISEFKQTVLDAIEEKCTEPDIKLSRDKLEELSDSLLEIILKGDGGKSLDNLAKLNQDEEY